jgi:hypothetical protein
LNKLGPAMRRRSGGWSIYTDRPPTASATRSYAHPQKRKMPHRKPLSALGESCPGSVTPAPGRVGCDASRRARPLTAWHRRRRGMRTWAGRIDAIAPDHGAAVAARLEIEAAFGQLSPEDRALLALRFYADLEVPDAAATLGIPLGTAKSRLSRALGRLRILLEQGQ